MQKDKVLGIAAAVMVLAAVVATNALGRIQTATLRHLPVEDFPKDIGQWRTVAQFKQDPEVQKKIPTARVVDRVYRAPDGREVNLSLLTATDYSDFHDPNICFPGQEYQLSEQVKTEVAGHRGRMMTASRGELRHRVFYWWSGSAAIDTKYGRDQMGRLLALRDRITGEQGHSLFVRVLTTDGPDAPRTLREFLQAANPAIADLTD